MKKNLTQEEITKINDFMQVYKEYINPDNNTEINIIIDHIIDSIIKIYIDYKDIIPFISITDDTYSYYILKPKDGKYCLLNYLINTVIQNLDSIILIDDKMNSNFNSLKKKIYINKKKTISNNTSIFNNMNSKIDKEKFLELYYKYSIYHEIGHMLHYKIKDIKEHTIYVPADYLSLSEFPPLKKRMSLNAKKNELERRKSIVKLRAKEKIKKRISMYYNALNKKYNILNPNEINDCEIEVESPNMKYEEIMLPPTFYINPVEEAFNDCDAQIYSSIFENDIFNINDSGNLNCFYLPIDNEHVIMTYTPSYYSFSASIGFAIKECINKIAYFRTMFLGKPDLFLEFLGKYEFLSTRSFSHKLLNANKGKIEEVQPLLDYIIDFYRNKGKSLDNLNIYFPLIYKDNKWVYYLDAINKIPPESLIKKREH